jgi:hypothetical protein
MKNRGFGNLRSTKQLGFWPLKCVSPDIAAAYSSFQIFRPQRVRSSLRLPSTERLKANVSLREPKKCGSFT